MSATDPVLLEIIAKQAYQATAIYLHANGHDMCPWDSLPPDVRNVMIVAVEEYVSVNFAHPINIHSRWYTAMKEVGWDYGEVFSNEAKTHPYMIAYDELPAELRTKDALFLQSVMASIDVANTVAGVIHNRVAMAFTATPVELETVTEGVTP